MPADTMTMKVNVSLGSLCPPISKQLEIGCRIGETQLSVLDQHADAVTWCYLHGLLTDAECERARRRLIRKIQRALRIEPATRNPQPPIHK